MAPDRRQAIIWTNAGILLIGPFGSNFSETLIEILTFSFKKMRLKVSSAKRRPFCLGLNELDDLPHRRQTWQHALLVLRQLYDQDGFLKQYVIIYATKARNRGIKSVWCYIPDIKSWDQLWIIPVTTLHNFKLIEKRHILRSWCVSSWWLWFPSRSSVLIYIYICVCVCVSIPYTSSVICRIYNGSVIQYWRSCTPSRSIGVYFWGVRGSWAECHFLFSLVYQLCLAIW